MPAAGWLTQVQIDASPAELTYDLAVDATGQGSPSRRAAGLELPASAPASLRQPANTTGWLLLLYLMLSAAATIIIVRLTRQPSTAR